MKLFFILRHGERADSAETERTYLYSHDPCLTEKGLEQAEFSAKRIFQEIQKFPDNPIVHIVSSPFLRCVETASKIALKLNLPIFIEEGFGELLTPRLYSEFSLDLLTVRTNPLQVEESLGVKIIENNHILRPKYPDKWPKSRKRVRYVWDEYLKKFENVNVFIVVTHLFVVDKIYEYWINEDRRDEDKGYCKLGIGRLNENYQIVQAPDSSFVFQ